MGQLNSILQTSDLLIHRDPDATKRVDIAQFIMGRYPLPQPPTLVTEK